jgi:hypothetical protein
MKWVAGSLAMLTGIALVGSGLSAVTIGLAADHEVAAPVPVGALTETPACEAIDLRAQIGFATSNIGGLMLVTVDALAHWVISPLDPYLGLGVGAALTPPPFSTGPGIEAVVGVRAAPANIVQLFLDARYLTSWSGGDWNGGPVLQGGLLVRY